MEGRPRRAPANAHPGRSTRSTPRRSRTSASGSATTRGPAPTTCTRSTVRCRGWTPPRRSTLTWPPATVPASGTSTYVAHPKYFPSDIWKLTPHADSPRRRAREDRGRQEALHQAAPHQGPQVPPPPPRRAHQHQEALQRQAPLDFRLRGAVAGCLGWCRDKWFRLVARVFINGPWKLPLAFCPY